MAAMASYGHFSNTLSNCWFFNTKSTHSADIPATPSVPKTINKLIYIEKTTGTIIAVHHLELQILTT
ncbi:MAG: hypothetical protein CTY16_09800 [Methylobacter sp.]|nr:MAG: hypothetical protein CTY16_09800 [Methylobacter sp.]